MKKNGNYPRTTYKKFKTEILYILNYTAITSHYTSYKNVTKRYITLICFKKKWKLFADLLFFF